MLQNRSKIEGKNQLLGKKVITYQLTQKRIISFQSCLRLRGESNLLLPLKGTITPTASTAIRQWEASTVKFYLVKTTTKTQ